MEEQLLVINEKDEIIGIDGREKCHAGDGLLHRAIADFIFNDEGELLIAQRSKLKKLWPESWDCSCCTHVYPYAKRGSTPLAQEIDSLHYYGMGGYPCETYEEAGERRLPFELGLSCELKYLTKFQYQIRFDEVSSENEICAILIGKYSGEVKPNPDEVANYKWISTEELKKDMQNNPDKYTPWFLIAFEKYLNLKNTKESKK